LGVWGCLGYAKQGYVGVLGRRGRKKHPTDGPPLSPFLVGAPMPWVQWEYISTGDVGENTKYLCDISTVIK